MNHSISQLTKEMNCTILLMQDHISRILISLDEKYEGLYYFKQIGGIKKAMALKNVGNESFRV